MYSTELRVFHSAYTVTRTTRFVSGGSQFCAEEKQFMQMVFPGPESLT